MSPEKQNIELRTSLLKIDPIHLIDELEDDVDNFQTNKRKLKTQINRLSKIRQKTATDKAEMVWSWDTSAALIRLMKRSRITNFIMNIYIWILMVVRVYYLSILIFYMVEDSDKQFFWVVFGVYFGVRVVFALIVVKILFYRDDQIDPKIKIVQEIYRQIYSNFT